MFLQDPQPASLLEAVQLALVPAIAWASSKAYDGLKHAVSWYDNLPATIHAIAAPLLAFGLGWVCTHAGVEAITDIHGWGAGAIGGLATALINQGVFRGKKAAA